MCAYRIGVASIAVFMVAGGGSLADEPSSTTLHETPSVIFDTDMGSDCDDAGALAVLHALADAGELRILAVIFSSGKNRYGVGTCDAINTYYGRGDLPLGQYQGTDVGDPADSYTKAIATDTERFGHDTVDQAPDLVSVYRKILHSQPDHSVTILTVGHPHGLVHLMRDHRAAELVQAKVNRWVAMGMGGWNFQQMGMSAYSKELLEEWPTPLFISPSGADIKTGNRQLPKTPETNPVREAYRLCPRRRKVTYPLINIVTIAVCAVICGADDFVAIAEFGRAKKKCLEKFLDLSEGIPSHDRFNAIFRRHQAGRVREMPAELDHGVARNHRRASRGHRRQDAAPQLRRGQQQVGHSHGQRLGDGQSHQPGPSRRRREEQRDHGDPETAGNPGDFGRFGDDRRHGMPDGNRRRRSSRPTPTTCWR